MDRKKLIPAGVLVLGLAIVTCLSLAALRGFNKRVETETDLTALHLKMRLESCIRTRIAVVNELATERWQNREQLTAGWPARSSVLLNLYPDIQALNYVDTDGVIRIISPVSGNEAALGKDLHNHPNSRVKETLAEAEASGQVKRSNSIQLFQSGLGMVIYQAIDSTEGQRLGYANGVFKLNDLITGCLKDDKIKNQFAFGIYEPDGTQLYATEPGPASLGASQQRSIPVGVANQPWRLELAPSVDYRARNGDQFDQTWMALGIILVLALTYATRVLLQKQDSLRQSQKKYKLLVENQTDMVVQIDNKGCFLYVSPSYCQMFGRTEEELLNKSFMPLVHEDDRELTAKSLATLVDPPHTTYHEQRAYTKDGWRWIAWSNVAVISKTGAVETISAVGRDVTNLKNLETRMWHSQKMQLIGEMAGGITHDFNNLLQVMLSNIEFAIMQSAKSQPVGKPLEQIRLMTERAMSLVDKLSRLSQQHPTPLTRLDLNEYVPEVIDIIERTLPDSLSLTLQLADVALPVEADKNQLEQVILNVCFNARDAVEGSGEIQVSLCHSTLDAPTSPA